MTTLTSLDKYHKLQPNSIPGKSNLEETKSVQATAPELGPVGRWSPKSGTFSGSDSIVVEEAARKFRSPRPGINKSHHR